MSVMASVWAFEVRGLQPVDRLVLVTLADQVGDHGFGVFDLGRVAGKLELSEAQVAACLRRMTGLELLRMEPLDDGRVRVSLAVGGVGPS